MLSVASYRSTTTIARNGEMISSMRLLLRSHWTAGAKSLAVNRMSTGLIVCLCSLRQTATKEKCSLFVGRSSSQLLAAPCVPAVDSLYSAARNVLLLSANCAVRDPTLPRSGAGC